MMRLSGSDYILDCSCPKALWLKKHRKDLYGIIQENLNNKGYEVQHLVRKLYPDGVMMEARLRKVI